MLGLVASPHGGGSTAAAVRLFLSGAAAAGADVDLVDLAHADSADAIAAMGGADAIVFGSPTYRASHTSLLAGLLEKVERGMAYESSAPLQGKATAIVMTGAAPEHFLATEGLRSKLSAFFATQVLAPSLFLPPAAYGDDKSIGSPFRDLVLLHGAALVELATAIRSSTAMSQLKPLV